MLTVATISRIGRVLNFDIVLHPREVDQLEKASKVLPIFLESRTSTVADFSFYLEFDL